METTLIKQKLHEFIDTLEDKRAEEIYELLEGEIDGGDEVEFNDEFLEELDRRHQDLLNGKNIVSAEDFKKNTKETLSKLKEKYV